MRIARFSRVESGALGAGVVSGMKFGGPRVVHSSFIVNRIGYARIMAKNYQSEITQFLNKYKKEHPDTEARQREGRSLLWDKHIDAELQEGFRAARVPQKPYVYQAD
jgi:hypothetical protein